MILGQIELKHLSLASPQSNSSEKACLGLTLLLIGSLSVMKKSFLMDLTPAAKILKLFSFITDDGAN
jgi:hypothetical protein